MRFTMTITDAAGTETLEHAEDFDVEAMIREDQGLEPDDAAAIRALPVGGEHVLGGGAAPLATIRRAA